MSEEITVREASAHSDLSISYLARLLKEGKITGRRIGYMWVVDKASLDAYVSEKHKPGVRKLPTKAEEETLKTEAVA